MVDSVVEHVMLDGHIAVQYKTTSSSIEDTYMKRPSSPKISKLRTTVDDLALDDFYSFKCIQDTTDKTRQTVIP